MNAKYLLRYIQYLPLLVLAVLTLVSCGPETKPLPAIGTPTVGSGTPVPTIAAGTATSAPTSAPTNTPLPTDTPTNTPTVTNTPTETPQPTFITTPGPRPTLVITPSSTLGQDAYNAAIASWRANNIQEYEVQLDYQAEGPFAGRWTLRVSESGNKIEVLSYSKDGSPPSTPTVGGESLKFLTVEDRFAQIEHRLSTQTPSAIDAQVDYLVTFDPTFGYPVSIEIRPKPNVKTKGLASTTIVESLTIIRRGTPVPSPPLAGTPTAPSPSPSPLGGLGGLALP